MSVSTSSDPVETVKDVLDDMEMSDWAELEALPDRIALSEASEPSEKLRNSRLSEVSVYVWSPATGVFDQHSAGVSHYIDNQVVQCDVYAGTTAKAGNAAADIRAHFAGNYWNDNSQKSNWKTIRPTEENDQRAGAFHVNGFHVVSVQLALMEKRSTS